MDETILVELNGEMYMFLKTMFLLRSKSVETEACIFNIILNM